MSSKSDVSKMLVSHRTPSVVSAGGPTRGVRVRNNETNNVTKQLKKNIQEQTRTSRPNSINSDVNKPLIHQTGITRTLLNDSSSNSKSNSTYGYLQMKCLDILKRAPGPLHTQELQAALGREHAIATDREFLSRLRGNPRVNFDTITKLWSFSSPFQSLTSPEALLNRLRTKELEVTLEVLEHNKEIGNWINSLLSKRLCRAVRGSKVSRCKVFSTESGLFCDLYQPEIRCDACKSLQGVVLYQRGPDAVEQVTIDADLRELWHQIPQSTLKDIEIFTTSANEQEDHNQ